MDKLELIANGYIPLDKPYHIRMGVLDILDGRDDTIQFLRQLLPQGKLNGDLKSLYAASVVWRMGLRKIYVGESATLYRFLKFASWKLKAEGKLDEYKKFVIDKTLQKREICDDPEIVNLPLEELLEKDHKTSQWASAAVIYDAIFGSTLERIQTDKPKLLLTYEAVDHWKERRAKGERWEIRYDDTIATQAEAYLGLLKTGKMAFEPRQAEDYCFARAFGIIKEEEIEDYRVKWESLEGHKSKRVDEMENALQQYQEGEKVYSQDHRVVQAIAMLAEYEGKEAKFMYKDAVKKSWPEFWKFFEDSRKLAA